MVQEIAEQELPFKVKRIDRPAIVFKQKPSKGGWVADTDIVNGKVIINVYPHKDFDKDIGSRDATIEHEVAHYQLGHDLGDIRKTRLEDRLRNEIQADLIVYARTGRPKNFLTGLQNLGMESSVYYNTIYPNVRESDKDAQIMKTIDVAVKEYWRWLPSQWKVDYNKWKDNISAKFKMIKHQYYDELQDGTTTKLAKKKVVKRKKHTSNIVRIS